MYFKLNIAFLKRLPLQKNNKRRDCKNMRLQASTIRETWSETHNLARWNMEMCLEIYHELCFPYVRLTCVSEPSTSRAVSFGAPCSQHSVMCESTFTCVHLQVQTHWPVDRYATPPISVIFLSPYSVVHRGCNTIWQRIYKYNCS
jgi:hypothetical protein